MVTDYGEIELVYLCKTLKFASFISIEEKPLPVLWSKK